LIVGNDFCDLVTPADPVTPVDLVFGFSLSDLVSAGLEVFVVTVDLAGFDLIPFDVGLSFVPLTNTFLVLGFDTLLPAVLVVVVLALCGNLDGNNDCFLKGSFEVLFEFVGGTLVLVDANDVELDEDKLD
jgi:hypothetical protein